MKNIFFAIVIFFFGIVIGGSSVGNQSTWKELKSVDDEVIGYAADMSGYCSTILDSVAKGDYSDVSEQTKNVTELTPKIMSASTRRSELLDKLGY